MMVNGRKVGAAVLVAAFAALLAPSAHAQYSLAVPQANELWGGPAAKGTGAAGSRYDTTVTVSAILASASGTVDYWAGGSMVASVPFSLSPRGVASISTPAALDGAGAFLYHVTASAAVMAFSETANVTPAGRFGLSVPAFTTADFLAPGDEASGGGAEDSTDPSRSRTNVGILCSPTSALACRLEASAYAEGALLGSGTLSTAPGSAAQSPLSSLVSAASGHTGVSLRLRVLQGLAMPYAIRNDNGTSDGTQIPLAVARGAFSTAPTITTFDATPASGCPPLSVTLTWATVGAVKVSISGVTGDLPPNGSTTVTLLTSTDLVLTATAATGATSSVPRHVTITPGATAPTPSPATTQTGIGKEVQGIIPPAPAGSVTFSFVQQQSQNSTFSLSGSTFTYTAGTTAGTDIIRLSQSSPCGPMTADFTVTVLPAGAPQILSFTADPQVGCAPQDTVLSWQTLDATAVEISGVYGYFSPNGSVGTTITTAGDTLFTLTAHGANGQTSTMDLTVHVDGPLEVPILSPNNVIVARGTTVNVDQQNNTLSVSSLGIVTEQNQSGSQFYYSASVYFPTPSPHFGGFIYVAGQSAGTDKYRVYSRNGCGFTYATFQSQVTP